MKAWEHHRRILLEKQAQAEAIARNAATPEGAGSPAFRLLRTAIEQECRKLSALPRGRARTERKRELLREYLPKAQAYCDGGEVFRNPVLTQIMVWAFDTGEIEQAMRLARVAVAQEQPMPERYKRDVRTAVADFVLEWAETRPEQQSPEPFFGELFEALFPADGSDGWPVCDELRIKYLKKAAQTAEAAGEIERALRLLEEAEAIDPKIAQVKTRKAKLEKARQKQAQEQNDEEVQ